MVSPNAPGRPVRNGFAAQFLGGFDLRSAEDRRIDLVDRDKNNRLVLDAENMRRDGPRTGGHDKRHLVARQELLRPDSTGIDRFEVKTIFSAYTFLDGKPKRQIGARKRRVADGDRF